MAGIGKYGKDRLGSPVQEAPNLPAAGAGEPPPIDNMQTSAHPPTRAPAHPNPAPGELSGIEDGNLGHARQNKAKESPAGIPLHERQFRPTQVRTEDKFSAPPKRPPQRIQRVSNAAKARQSRPDSEPTKSANSYSREPGRRSGKSNAARTVSALNRLTRKGGLSHVAEFAMGTHLDRRG